jgi:hypothetical protein
VQYTLPAIIIESVMRLNTLRKLLFIAAAGLLVVTLAGFAGKYW